MNVVSDILSGSTTLTGTFSTSGSIEVAGGELFLTNATVASSGLVIDPGAVVSPLDVPLAGFASSAVNTSTINADLVNDGTLAFVSGNAADRFVINGSVSGTGSIELFQTLPVAAGEMTITGAVSQGQTVVFEPDSYLGSGYAERLSLGDGSGFAGTISGFSEAPGRLFGQDTGDQLTLANAAGTSVTGSQFAGDASGGVLTLTDGTATLDRVAFTGDYTLANFAISSSGATAIVTAAPCFAAGTRLRTPQGERAVKTLRPGETVVLASGGTAPIVWIGHRRVECARHPEPASVRPVRVRAHAFAPDLPSRDVVLSPEHALFLEGVLIPVGALVDGHGIVQEAWDRVTYYHVELAAHDVMLAAGLPVESYLDTGNRHDFANAPLVSLVPNFTPARAALALNGPAVAAVRARLRDAARRDERAASLRDVSDAAPSMPAFA